MSEFGVLDFEDLEELEDWAEFEGLRYRTPGVSGIKCGGRTVRLYGEVWVSIPFWRSYRRFRRELEPKVGRYTTYRSDRGRRVRRLIANSNLKEIHRKLELTQSAGGRTWCPKKEGDLVRILIIFTFVGMKGDRRACKLQFFTYGWCL